MMHHDHIEPEEIWRNIVDYSKINGLLFASSGNEKNTLEGHSSGAQLFAINDAFEITIPNTDQRVKLLKMKDLNN